MILMPNNNNFIERKFRIITLLLLRTLRADSLNLSIMSNHQRTLGSDWRERELGLTALLLRAKMKNLCIDCLECQRGKHQLTRVVRLRSTDSPIPLAYCSLYLDYSQLPSSLIAKILEAKRPLGFLLKSRSLRVHYSIQKTFELVYADGFSDSNQPYGNGRQVCLVSQKLGLFALSTEFLNSTVSRMLANNH
jgi:hypothetical protein